MDISPDSPILTSFPENTGFTGKELEGASGFSILNNENFRLEEPQFSVNNILLTSGMVDQTPDEHA